MVIKIKRLIFLLIAMNYSVFVLTDTLSEAKETAKNIIGKPNLGDNNLPTSMYKGEDVAAKDLIDKDLESEARLKIANDSDSAEIYNGAVTRPRIVFDTENDPRFIQDRENRNAASAMVDGGYEGCAELKSTPLKIGEEVKQCDVKGYRDSTDFSCYREWSGRCKNNDINIIKAVPISSWSIIDNPTNDISSKTINASAGIIEFSTPNNKRNENCPNGNMYRDNFQLSLPDGWKLHSLTYETRIVDDWLFLDSYSLKDRNENVWWVHGVIGKSWDHKELGSYNCEQGNIKHENKIFDLMPYLKSNYAGNSYYLSLNHRVGGGGDWTIRFKAMMVRDCDIEYELSKTCDNGFIDVGDNIEVVNSEICIDDEPRTRPIGNGYEGTRSCWKYKTDYKKWSEPYFIEDGACDGLRKDGCQQENTGICYDENNAGFCNAAKIDFTCGVYASSDTVDLCGSILPCQDGECSEDLRQPYDATEDFKETATYLAMVDSMLIEFDIENMLLFQGMPATCDDKGAMGYSNCCDGDGWGQDLDLLSCTDNEGRLMEAMANNRAVSIGSEKKGTWPLEYRRYKYCQFPSQIGYLIVKGAYEQLGLNFGSYTNPNCSGLTFEQFEQVDFSQIDLSEYFDEVTDNALSSMQSNLPSAEVMAERLRQQVNNL